MTYHKLYHINQTPFRTCGIIFYSGYRQRECQPRDHLKTILMHSLRRTWLLSLTRDVSTPWLGFCISFLLLQPHPAALQVWHGPESSAFTRTLGTALVAQTVNSLPAVRATQVRSLGWEDPLEKELATHSKIPWMEEPGRLQSMESQRVRHDWATSSEYRQTPTVKIIHPLVSKPTGCHLSYLHYFLMRQYHLLEDPIH